MQTPTFRPLHAARHGRDLVLLDATEGAYHCLAGAADAVEVTESRERLRVIDPDLAQTLAEARLLISGADLICVDPSLPAPVRDLADLAPKRARWRDAPAIAASLGRLAPNYYGRPFRHLIEDARRHHHLPAPPDLSDEMLEAVARHCGQAPWTPFQGLCLYRSYALLRWLRRDGLRAHWVFGVQTWPFAAHCWLQVGEAALDESADAARAYSPILIV